MSNTTNICLHKQGNKNEHISNRRIHGIFSNSCSICNSILYYKTNGNKGLTMYSIGIDLNGIKSFRKVGKTGLYITTK